MSWRRVSAWFFTALIVSLFVLLFVPQLRAVAGVIWAIVLIPIAIAEYLYVADDWRRIERRADSEE